jgi:hypothetical protein
MYNVCVSMRKVEHMHICLIFTCLLSRKLSVSDLCHTKFTTDYCGLVKRRVYVKKKWNYEF